MWGPKLARITDDIYYKFTLKICVETRAQIARNHLFVFQIFLGEGSQPPWQPSIGGRFSTNCYKKAAFCVTKVGVNRAHIALLVVQLLSGKAPDTDPIPVAYGLCSKIYLG